MIKSLRRILLFLVYISCAHCKEQVHIVSYDKMLLPHEESPLKYSLLKDNFDVTFYHDLYAYVKNFSSDSPELKKIIFLDYCEDPATGNLPLSKMICFKWEAIRIPSKFYSYFYRVYTFDDALVDNQKFFKFYYPVLNPMIEDIPHFADKDLCVMVVSNWMPDRLAIVDFFNTKPKDTLHIYGWTPEGFPYKEMYKGSIPGYYSGKEKLHTLKKYRFCLCFENTYTVPGYITEKLFDAFASGCVPIYKGPANVGDYIPASCFVNYNLFNTNEELYHYISSITETEYTQLLENIQLFLHSEEAQLFSQAHFEEILYRAILD